MNLSILDRPIAALKRALPSFSLGELEVLKQAEEDGKTRKGAIEVIEEAIAEADPPEPEADPCLITPTVEGMTIRLHDGTRLPYGESARTTLEHAEHLRALGFAR